MFERIYSQNVPKSKLSYLLQLTSIIILSNYKQTAILELNPTY